MLFGPFSSREILECVNHTLKAAAVKILTKLGIFTLNLSMINI